MMTLDLFSAPAYPEGFAYKAEALSIEEEHDLLLRLGELPFEEFDFHGFLSKRRVISFGWKYDFTAARLRQAEAVPDFLKTVRQRAATALERDPETFGQLLVTEYGPGAGIGWHRDKAVFGEVIGVSLAAACTLRLRRPAGEKWQRASIELAPRSVYLLSGEVRSDWEHSIPPVAETRYSLTFRTLGSK
jgi:alkylated DNA repair dioxygenase AlkB